MINFYDIIFALFFSFLSALILTPIIGFLAVKLKILDYPNAERKVHKKPIPLLGGLSVFFAFSLVMFFYYEKSIIFQTGTVIGKNLLGIFFGGLFLSIGGFLDDKFNLKPWQQIFWPIMSVLTVIFFGIGIEYITNPFASGLFDLTKYNFNLFWWHGFPYKLTLLADIFTFFWLMSMMYTTKLLDGVDGLVSGVSIIGALFIFLTALNKADFLQFDIALLAIILLGAFAGFLVFNFNPATIFLGESGSTLAGFLLGSLSIMAGSKVGVTLIVMSIPILDFLWTIIRRKMEGKSAFRSSDRKHLHHRLLDAGFSQKMTVFILYGITLAFGILAYFMQDFGLSLLILVLLAVIIFILLGAYLYKKQKERSKILTL
ncbi:MAG: MraY family glycosyltransferase [Patescibacteria group bacterium]